MNNRTIFSKIRGTLIFFNFSIVASLLQLGLLPTTKCHPHFDTTIFHHSRFVPPFLRKWRKTRHTNGEKLTTEMKGEGKNINDFTHTIICVKFEKINETHH